MTDSAVTPLWTRTPARLLAIVFTLILVVGTQAYYAYSLSPYYHNLAPLVFGVLVPALAGSVALILTGMTAEMFGFVAIFLSVVDDIPVLFDWPRLNGFPPGVSHDSMQIVLYVLSFTFIVASIATAARRYHNHRREIFASLVLGMLSLAIAYGDDIPLGIIADYANAAWYQLDVLEHVVSLVVFIWSMRILGATRYLGGNKGQVESKGHYTPTDTRTLQVLHETRKRRP